MEPLMLVMIIASNLLYLLVFFQLYQRAYTDNIRLVLCMPISNILFLITEVICKVSDEVIGRKHQTGR